MPLEFKKYNASESTLKQATEDIKNASDPEAAADILNELLHINFEEDDLESALAITESAMRTFWEEDTKPPVKSDLLNAAVKIMLTEHLKSHAEKFFADQDAKAQPDSFEAALLKYHRGYSHLQDGQFDEAESLFQKAADMLETLNLPVYKADCIHALGNSKAMQKDYDTAVDLYEEAAEIFISSGAVNKAQKCFLNTRILFKQAATPKHYIKHCKNRLKHHKNTPAEAYYIFEISTAYELYGNKAKQKKYLLKAIDLKEAAGIDAELGTAYSMLADYYDSEAKDEKAIDAYLKAARLMAEQKEFEAIGPVVNFLQESEDEMSETQKELYDELNEFLASRKIEIS